jgi:hypothetical protein
MFKISLLVWLGIRIVSTFAVHIDQEGLPNTGLNTSTWQIGQLPPLDDIFDLNDMQIAAKNTLSPKSYGPSVLCLLQQTY